MTQFLTIVGTFLLIGWVLEVLTFMFCYRRDQTDNTKEKK
jgi:hypothetical protein